MKLGLVPLQGEGGLFRETYRSRDVLRGRPRGPRRYATAIYYLLTAGDFSALHRLKSDEVYHFYLGDPVELFIIGPGGRLVRTVLGTELERGMRPQAVVLKGRWQGARLAPGGSYALLGTTVAPGFDLRDFELGDRDRLLQRYRRHRRLITELTRKPG